jgi:hypothetical protein
MICEFSVDKSQGLEVKLLCNIANQPCSFYRYCTTKKSVTMLGSYQTCILRGDQMANRGRPPKTPIETNIPSPIENLETKNIEEKIKTIKPKKQTKICSVINKDLKKFAIDFDGCGISFRDSSPNKTNQVEVIYSGEFKTPLFKIESYKFI